jgi:hypothetical protein
MSKIVEKAIAELLDCQMLSACESGKMGRVRELLRGGFEIDRVMNVSGFSGTALHAAVAHRKMDLCVMLLSAGARHDLANAAGVVPLGVACRAGDLLMCQLLQSAGANVHDRSADGASLLNGAVEAGAVSVVKWLLEKCVDPNLVSEDWLAPLHLVSAPRAAGGFKAEIAALLVKHGAISCYVPRRPPSVYRTPFQVAVAGGDLPAVRYFVEACNENLWQRSHSGATLLQLAQRYPSVLKYLRDVEDGVITRKLPIPVNAPVLSKRRSFEWPSRS